MGDVFNPPVRPVGDVPRLPPQTQPRMIRVSETAWVDRHRVRAVTEEFYMGSDSWQVRVHLTGGVIVTGDGRATDVIAALNGDLR